VLDTTIAQTNTNNVNKTWALLRTTGGKDEPKLRFYAEIIMDITTRNSEYKDTQKQHIIVSGYRNR
jgi:hypothetical protein